MAGVQAVEVVNGTQADGPRSGVGFWERQLQLGQRMTAIGGSDSHNPGAADGRSPIGLPAPLVPAPARSRRAMLPALKQGRVVVDVHNASGSRLDLWLDSDDGQRAEMGQQLKLPAGQWATLKAELDYPQSARLEFIVDGRRHPVTLQPGDNGSQQASLRWRSQGTRHWLRVDVRDEDGNLLMLGNPVYVNWSQ